MVWVSCGLRRRSNRRIQVDSFAGIVVVYFGCMGWIKEILVTHRELMPTAMSPNSIMDEAFALVQQHESIVRICGEPMKAYGRGLPVPSQIPGLLSSPTFLPCSSLPNSRFRLSQRGQAKFHRQPRGERR